MTTLAFIGFGAMGRPMVRHLLAAGHRINVSVRRPEAADAVKALGAQPCHSPAEAARDADVVFTNVTSTADVEEVLFGPQGVVEGARPGTLCIDHSTISPVATRHIAERLQAAGLRFLDAPVSGGAAGAEAATLTIMVGGDSADLEQARPLLERLGKTIAHVGGPGSGQVAKACNQMVQVTTIQGIAEAML
ncbi:MAG TPA: NAD(P)-dependent oxidoreductase, partial [Burkholderiaceae bacterium]|nr:NAD(P)-dependent oxidoreductase [Burkholderiaceae bacterium]